MVRSREAAVKLAKTKKTNVPGTCQLWVREIFGAPSAGDRDGDRDADAVDGWLSEPEIARGKSRTPDYGYPIAFSGGSKGYGHRAISLGGGFCIGTDMSNGRYAKGIVGTATIAQVEKAMGVKYLGWSSTITGIPIPSDVKPKTSRGARIDNSIEHAKKIRKKLKEALSTKDTERKKKVELAAKANETLIDHLKSIKKIK